MDELRAALELATEEELQQLTELLFGRRFNPLDYVNTPQPIDVQSRDRDAWLDALERRFRYLAADGITVLRGKTGQVTYRQALIQVCRYLKIPYSKQLSTTDLEAEIFLSLLGRAWKRLPASEQEALTGRVQDALAKSEPMTPLPISVQKDPLGLLFKAGSALAVSSLIRPFLLGHIARQFALHFAQYQVARQTLIRGGAAAATQIQGHLAVQAANRGMAVTAARYGVTRSVLGFLGPVLWTWFLADLGWRAISTNYARIIPTIFALAQIRLTRSDYSWQMA
ncbi:hypothetical protein [Lyngbya sp. CCY1209]|uniref:YaaW family protein n=1 Tax=Lyngbya sp. CCY1209 TaxID=2886103 RepID=UPI002D217204|nr:hypothetical protein [Lyngbya sp. CCY1209]MEB3886590.1 hypothetical protein [Lyngbya sp. CCY1209]